MLSTLITNITNKYLQILKIDTRKTTIDTKKRKQEKLYSWEWVNLMMPFITCFEAAQKS